MTNTTQSTVRLLNKNYVIKGPEAETQNLDRASIKLNMYLMQKKEQFRHLDDYGLLLLAALQVSHELIVHQNKQSEQNQQLSQLISLLEDKINRS